MIHVNVTGRCGNQMFQYAFARKLSLLTGDEELEFDFYNVKRWQEQTNETSFDDQLKSFNVLPYLTSYDNKKLIDAFGSNKQKYALVIYSFMQKVFLKLFRSSMILQRIYIPKMNKLGLFVQETPYTKPVNTKEKEKLIKGYFENKKYFDDIREVLLKEFTPKYPEKEKNKHLYKIIKENESVCVSFRTWAEVDESVKIERDVCGKDYYQKAISEIMSRIPNAVLIVFSDDINWVRNNYDFESIPVYYEDGTDEIWEKMRLMYSCKHFIMTTSTFTWWAQYLSRNDNKLVISPDHWYNGERQSMLICPEWILIH